jgi:DNA-binding transcriptional ArsR family regulator
MAYGQTLAALAHPTRRRVYERLRREPHTVGELARLARLSQPGVSQHLRVLQRARLVTHTRMGTRRYYRASREGLVDLRKYLESLWDDMLAAYAAADPEPPHRGTVR